MLETIFKIKKIKLYIIITLIAMVLLLFLPIFAKFTENNATSQIITNYGYDSSATSPLDGGNNYVTIPDDTKTEEELKKHLTNSGLWNASIDSSNEAQIEWYRKLSERLEKTYLTEAKAAGEYDTSETITGTHANPGSYLIEYTGDFGCQECDYNGPQKNHPILDRGTSKKGTCTGDNKDVFKVEPKIEYYYESKEATERIGGKILGVYPDILVSASLANTYSLLDQNDVYGYELEDEIIKIQNTLDTGGSYLDEHIRRYLFGLLSKTGEKLMAWYATFDNVASAKNALDDIFAEGALYTTFQFLADSKCKVKDVARYNKFTGERHKVTNEYGNKINYVCKTSGSLSTDCVTQTYPCTKKDPETGKEYTGTCEKQVAGATQTYSCTKKDPKTGKEYTGTCEKQVAGLQKSTAGYPDSYYQHLDGTRSCDYIEGYKLEVEWVCLPSSESESETDSESESEAESETDSDDSIKCSVTPVKDDRGEILYYKCIGINESEVREKIVNPVFDAYEDNILPENGYMTAETAKKYVYSEDEEEEKKSAKGVNPKGYKIDEETRQIVTKHIVMEILGQIEGREPALADKEGNFYIQSYNRVLNKEQYRDALNNTIFVKDNLLRKEAKEKNTVVDNDSKYSEKLYGVFYSKYNEGFGGFDASEIARQKAKDSANKKSQINEIFSTYDYVAYYLRTTEGSSGGTTGSGLAQADASGFQQRVSAPSYSGYWDNGINIYYGECPWYALGRVREILANAGSDYNWTYAGNGGNWCDKVNQDKNNFIVERNHLKAKPGSIVSWKDTTGSYGHVAIVEEVTPTGVTISESYISLGIYGDRARSLIYNNGYNPAVASKNCSINGCWQRRTLTYDQMQNHNWKDYEFQCYIHLLKDEDLSSSSSQNSTTSSAEQ